VPTLTHWTDAVKAAAEKSGAEIVNFFNCQGEMSQRVVDMLLADDDPNVRKMGEFGREATMGQPDESRVEKAREYARETMKKI
jgi:hypothetical protein